MIVIADGGSTKADWRIVFNGNTQISSSTIGFNPFFFTSEAIEKELKRNFVKEFPVNDATKVYFYGAGCSDPFRCSILEEGLQPIFPNAKVIVDHDLMAAARATCEGKPGIACILGTGSNSCHYDGDQIIDHITNLGHLLGDEGSGSYLGKMLVRGYFYREFPDDIKAKFEDRYSLGKRELINRIYDYNTANVFLASFAKFPSDNKDHIYIQQLVNKAFSEFIDRHVRKYKNHNVLPIHFVGSIAYHFKEILNLVLQGRNLTLGTVIKKPIDNLVEYHINFE
jgi:N-acetylglucosamine kinase-like BadF-type ATPase